MSRDPLLAKIHIAKKDLGLNDADYRAVLEGVTGQTSAAKLSRFQREAVLERFAELGWQPKKQQGKSPASRHDKRRKTQAAKIRAMWIDMHNLGIVRNGSEQALGAYLYRMVKVSAVEWLDAALTPQGKRTQSDTVIEALKKWCKRKTDYDDPRDIPETLRQEIIRRNAKASNTRG